MIFSLLFSLSQLIGLSCSDDAVLNLTIHSICSIDLTPDTISMFIDSGGGGTIDPYFDSQTRYKICNNMDSAVILVSLNEDMPGGSTLEVTMDPVPPTGVATTVFASEPPVTAQSNIPRIESDIVFPKGFAITYEFNTPATLPPQGFSRIVTFTLMDSGS